MLLKINIVRCQALGIGCKVSDIVLCCLWWLGRSQTSQNDVCDQMQTLRDHGKQFNDGRYELYKSTMKYDHDLGRGFHGYPLAAELPL